MARSILFAFIMAAIAGCETVPTEMPSEAFEVLLEQTEATASISSVEKQIETALAREDLSSVQRADLLLLRADKRSESQFNLPGALEDVEIFLSTTPEHPSQVDAEASRLEIQAAIEATTKRLAGLQNLPDWFDDQLRMGAIEEGAKRYQRSGLTPTLQQTELLLDAGYICVSDASGSGADVHSFGDAPDYAKALVWCDLLPDS